MSREALRRVWGKRRASEKWRIRSPHAPNGANCSVREERRVRRGRRRREMSGDGGDAVGWVGVGWDRS